ncbi:hypothetical protein Hdeb2414_s0007g00244731 [Helianthus debilis subsp. tardiflorus]
MAQRREAGEQLAFPPSSTKNLLDLLDWFSYIRQHFSQQIGLIWYHRRFCAPVCPPQLIVSLKYIVVASPATSAAARSTTRSHQIN